MSWTPRLTSGPQAPRTLSATRAPPIATTLSTFIAVPSRVECVLLGGWDAAGYRIVYRPRGKRLRFRISGEASDGEERAGDVRRRGPDQHRDRGGDRLYAHPALPAAAGA